LNHLKTIQSVLFIGIENMQNNFNFFTKMFGFQQPYMLIPCVISTTHASYDSTMTSLLPIECARRPKSQSNSTNDIPGVGKRDVLDEYSNGEDRWEQWQISHDAKRNRSFKEIVKKLKKGLTS
jgi:hypothetical protein